MFLTGRRAVSRATPVCGAAAIWLAGMPALAQAPETLTFCVLSENLPMSGRGSPPGFEVELADAVAARLGARARFEWLRPEAETPEQAVLERRCDAASGAIVDRGTMAGNGGAPGIALSAPYYEAAYVLIRRREAPPIRSLEELGNESRLAVESHSVAAFTLRQRGYDVHVLRDPDAVVRAVIERREEYGYLWGPLAGWRLRNRTDVVVAEEFEPRERWRFAFAVRAADAELRSRMDRALAGVSRDGIAARIFASYGVPYTSP